MWSCFIRNRFVNYGWYGAVGVKNAVTLWKPLKQCIKLKVDDRPIKLHKSLLALVILNIPSYMGGADLWGESSAEWNPQTISDEYFEVVGIRGFFHLGQITVKLSKGIRLAQGNKVEMLSIRKTEAQIDGEPFKLTRGFLTLSHHGKATVLLNSEKDKRGKVAAKLTGNNQFIIPKPIKQIKQSQRFLFLSSKKPILTVASEPAVLRAEEDNKPSENE